MHNKTIIFRALLKDTLVMVQNFHESAIKVNIQKNTKSSTATQPTLAEQMNCNGINPGQE